MDDSYSSSTRVAVLTEGRCEAEECAEHVVYGLALYCAGKPVASITDISPDCEKVKQLVSLCNEGGVTEDTVWDIVEDYLS